ncbi:MAG: hypothetical protein EON54_28240, partial [Alcaligenaceae bacterium]
MQLITEIIDLLSDHKSSTQSALLKAQVLAHKLGDATLATWVGNELRGYSADAELPNYRTLHGMVMGSVSNGYHRYTDTTISLEALDLEHTERLTKRSVHESISTIEAWSENIRIPLDPLVCALLSTAYENGFAVQTAYLKFGIGAVPQILTQIRS